MRAIGIVCGKGGVGKTTTAVHLAAGLAEKGLKTCLLDTDPQGHAAWWAEQNEESKFDHAAVSDPVTLASIRPQLEGYDVVVVDTPQALYSKGLKATVAFLDEMIVPTKTSPFDMLRATVTVNDVARASGLPHRVLITMVDGRRQRDLIHTQKAFQGIGIPMCKTRIRAYADFENVQAQGALVYDWRGASAEKASRDYRALVNELSKEWGKHGQDRLAEAG